MRTTVGIIGGGPAGLLLARMLHRAGIDCVLLESRDRTYVEQRQRAGTLEQTTIDALRAAGAHQRLDREGMFHDGIEIRFARRSHRIDFAALANGRQVVIHPQTKVVQELVALNLADGVPVLFEARADRVEGAEGDRPVIHFTHGGTRRALRCDFVVGCDGFHGISRRTVPDALSRTFSRRYPYSWLGILADVAPSCDDLLYAHSPNGFALHSMRSSTVSRLYLQVPNGTDPGDWDDERIWDELSFRFAVDGDWKLDRGPITAKSVIPMQSFVTEPLRHGRLFLAGDAAHIVPPTGAKGLNLAVADVVVLARALTAWADDGSTELIDAYSDTCLRRVWQAEHFSWFMTTTFHRAPGQPPFEDRLQLTQLERLAAGGPAAAELADNYTGLPIG
ncbi:4-hydroxybenzoate 3-monooxygenase [Streptomyces sp. NPDC057509]|uniref:4-hydroxybenzoate 3-monooxygenase n=1 Tax=Streptomyces sp. NPDC057509 TaxID=3346152 RepID=UPI0036AF00EF